MTSIYVVQHHAIVPALVQCEFSDSRYDRFILREGAFSSDWVRGWLDPSADLDVVAKMKIISPTGNVSKIFHPMTILHSGQPSRLLTHSDCVFFYSLQKFSKFKSV